MRNTILSPRSNGLVSTELVPATDLRATVISIDVDRHSGSPCFKGTRVPIEDLWDFLAAGETIDSFLDSFPTVTREQAAAAIHLAGKHLIVGLPST